MTRGKTPSPAASLHEQTVRQHCRALKMPTVAGQFETLAQAAIREGHGHVQYPGATHETLKVLMSEPYTPR